MGNKLYRKPFLFVETFTSNEYVSLCDVETKYQLFFEDSAFYSTIYWDKKNYGYCDPDEKYSYAAIPFPLYMDMGKSKSEGFYNEAGFVNQPPRPLYFYRSNKYSTSTKLGIVYAAVGEDGNFYFFKSKPTVNEVEAKNHS